MICAVIKGPSYEEASQQIQKIRGQADLIEWRLDLFHEINVESIQILRSQSGLPALFTLRSKGQGGQFPASENERKDVIRTLARLNPEYLDLEDDVPAEFVKEIKSSHPKIKIMVSHHDFEGTPENFDSIFESMKQKHADIYKVAFLAKKGSDALRLLQWARSIPEPIIPISMGEFGQVSRIIGPLFGFPITYAAVDDASASAPGQLTVSDLVERYRYKQMNTKTALYGLIGLPVTGSVSDVTHNAVFQRYHVDGVYVKMPVLPEELQEFLGYAKALGFKGISVTMPLKEAVMECLDRVDPIAQKIGAVNTLVFNEGNIEGYNTDGTGALNAIENKIQVKEKHLVIVGAGGAAKAIAYEAHRRGALTTVINRDVDKAQRLAEGVGGNYSSWNDRDKVFLKGYDLMINSAPIDFALDPQWLSANAIYMDVKTKPKTTEFLKSALDRGHAAVYGYEMFIEQALGQFELWFRKKLSVNALKSFLYASFRNQ